ncbi:MAG: phosphoribosylamine--glycine ligase [Oscillospiraceae bacterium]|nr:phosphoribosylamine--glycine ligase [Oscillospiraceae bacterium]
MKILIVGSGGREHAIGWKLKQNPVVNLFFAPGNGGTEEIGENIPINVDEVNKLADYAERTGIDITVVGPELPLTLGITDEFNKRNLKIFGPCAEAAKLEGSKAFAKQFMKKHSIPTANYNVITNMEEGEKLIANSSFPVVVKANGLAAGKGVVICMDREEAITALKNMLVTGIFGEAGNLVVIEEYLIGKEVSLLCFTDGEAIIPMETASDYKRALDNDMGANTGGMGSISPSPYYTPGLGDEIANKTLDGIKSEGFGYCGVIYIGLILTDNGPKVLEYNVRFGDPETEALLPRLESDLCQIMMAVTDKKLSGCKINWSDQKAVCVVLASEGYPGEYETGFEVDIPKTKSFVFHAGTVAEEQPGEQSLQLVTDGGRVLAVTALGSNFEDARKVVYDDISKIQFEGKKYRTDIGATK